MKIQKDGSARSSNIEPEQDTGQVHSSRPAMSGGTGGGQTAFKTSTLDARTTCHTHPASETLIVTADAGWVQAEGSPRRDIVMGDAVWIPAGEKHWRGASAITGMMQLAVSEYIDDVAGNCLELVTDEEYLAG